MSDGEKKSITESTRISVSVTSWWHLAILIGTIVWWGVMIKVSIDSAGDIAKRALEQSVRNDQLLQILQSDLKVFHQKYEDDMDRYIREHPKQHY